MSNLETFVQRHRNNLIAGALALGITGGALYYLYSSSSQAGGDSTPGSPGAKKAKSKSKTKSKSKGKKKTGSKSSVLSHGFPTEQVPVTDGPRYPVIEDMSAVKQLDEKTRKEIADEFKLAGNAAFNNKLNDLALEMYTKAIEVYDSDAIYYSNRSAVYGALEDFPSVVKDTTKALDLRPDYTKCFNRRGLAYERLEDYSESVMDYTAACILSNFEDENMGRAVDRVLRKQAEKIVEERYKTAKVEWPSPSFVSAYLSSFHKRDLPADVVDAEEGTPEYDVKLAFDAIEKENLDSYKQAFAYLGQALEKGLKNPEVQALALEFQATFKFLLNDMEGAMLDINNSIELNPTVQALIKRSSLHIELGQLELANADFARADQLDPNSADTQYQLAQFAFLQQDWDTAIEHYNRSIKIDGDFLLAHIQSAVTKYRKGDVEVAKHKFEQMVKKNPDNSNVHNYYGEILLDMKDIDGASAQFDEAIRLELAKDVAAINVVPLINKALAIASSSTGPAGINSAIELCRKAAAIDPASDVAIGTLAQFCLQIGQNSEAIELFERNADLARTRAEQIQAITFAEASKTQNRISRERPILRERLEIASRYRQ